MINFRSVNSILLLLTSAAVFLSLFRIFNLHLLDVAAYSSFFWGINFFYSSYLKQYKAGITFGSVLFLSGSILFVIAQYEILNFGSVFVPTALVLIGLSLLIANMLSKVNVVVVLFSTLSLIAGVWLIIKRSAPNMDLFLSAAYVLIKSYWIIILISAGIIFLVAISFKKKDDHQN